MTHRSGYAAILGKPNAGKSTLMNRILGVKLSIATHKAQTTRHQVVGILSDDDSQVVFLDTPGIISPTYSLQKAMMKTVERAKADADVVVFLFDPGDPHPSDEVVDLLRSFHKPILLAVNKCDRYGAESSTVRTAVEALNPRLPFHKVFHVSALTGDGIDALVADIKALMPEGPPLYPKDDLSEHPMRFFASELIREQIFLQYHEEIPYSCTVEISQYEEGEDMDRIHAEIVVNRESQKGILIGKGAAAIRSVGIKAREAIEEFTGRKAYLDLRVKVREKWREDERWVRRLGY